MNLEKFQPNLIPNFPKSGEKEIDKIIQKNGGYLNYFILKKKDGVRVQLIQSEVLGRSLKTPGSKLVTERFKKFAEQLHELGIAIDSEFYWHGQKFNTIFRFFSKSDVTCPKYKAQLEKELQKNPEKFNKEYDGLGVDFLTQFHDELELHIFDGIILDKPEVVTFEDRMQEIKRRLAPYAFNFVQFPEFHKVSSAEELEQLYEQALEEGYEGLVLTHQSHKYKFGRNSLNEGTLLKMKSDEVEWDGVVVDVVEGTVVKEGIERTRNELGESVTSKKKDDREQSGLAKGFVVQFEDKGTFIVGLNGFDHQQRRELLENKQDYIGRHFVYTGMEAVKDFPRHSFFKHWRDEK